jgi:peptidyl-prolyl cis-trans isomerase C
MIHASTVRAALVGLALGGLAGTAFAADPKAETPKAEAPKTEAADPVVARVNGQEIRKSDVLHSIAGLPAQIRQMPVETLFPPILDQLINSRLVIAAGYQGKLAEDPEVKEKLKRAEERAVQEVYIGRQIKARLSEEAIKSHYQHYLGENPPEDEVRARHILVATEGEAKTILDQLKAGADFAKLAQDKSSDSAAAAQGGDLGYFTRGAMVAEFAEAAFAGTPGKLVDKPVHTQFGWHVIRVDDKRKTQPRSLEEVRGELESEASQEIIQTIIHDLRAGAKVEQFQIDGTPAPVK